MIHVNGGVCAPTGFKAAGVHCGFRKNKRKNDLSLITSDSICSIGAVYTTNKVHGAPIKVTRKHVANGYARALICNSGNANTCAPNGMEIAENTCRLTAEALGIDTEDVIVSSTGVIGQEINFSLFEEGIPALVSKLSTKGATEAARGIMTTDTIDKEISIQFRLGDCVCTMGAMGKGSGMVHPNMATTLSFITTDVAITPEMLQKALSDDVKDSFNQVSVDGDTSTNDMSVIMANGLAGNKIIDTAGGDFDVFCKALNKITSYLSKKIAEDGEGASKLIICNVENACSKEIARAISKSIVSSNLFKTAMYGEDANWGRIICAIGYTPGDFNVDNIDISVSSKYGEITVCKGSKHNLFSEDDALDVLSGNEITVNIDMHDGNFSGKAWGCDLTFEYVKINGDYRR